jgi:hypothetical protein
MCIAKKLQVFFTKFKMIFLCSLSMDSSITVRLNVGCIGIQCVVLNGFNA